MAQKHLDMLSELLTKLDPSGALSSTSSMAAEDVLKSSNDNGRASPSHTKKRKSTEDSNNNKHAKNSRAKMDGGNTSGAHDGNHAHNDNEPLTIPQREERAFDNLILFLKKDFNCNGKYQVWFLRIDFLLSKLHEFVAVYACPPCDLLISCISEATRFTCLCDRYFF